MPIDPCTEGCLNHMIGAGEGPTAGDDPCNSAGNGYFCEGSYWTYDPTVGGADVGTWGDCPRVWLRTGPDCNVDQWLELSVASVITDTVAPVDGVDCCPPGTLWCVPAAGDVSVNQIWIQTGCVGDNCRWCKICGDHTHEIFVDGLALVIPDSVLTNIPYDTVNINHLGGATVPTITVPETGCYQFEAWALLDYTGNNFDSALIRLILMVNGAPARNLGDQALMTLNRPLFDQITIPIEGGAIACLTAGDTVGAAILWGENFHTQPITLIESVFSMTISHQL